MFKNEVNEQIRLINCSLANLELIKHWLLNYANNRAEKEELNRKDAELIESFNESKEWLEKLKEILEEMINERYGRDNI